MYITQRVHFLRGILVNMQQHDVVEPLLGHYGPQVIFETTQRTENERLRWRWWQA